MKSRAMLALFAALGLAIAAVGYALWFFIAQSGSQNAQLQRQQRLIGGLQDQVSQLGGIPLTVPPKAPKARATQQPASGGGGGVPGVAPTVPTAPPTALQPSPQPTPRPSSAPSRSPGPKPSSQSPTPSPTCVLVVCLRSPLPTIVPAHPNEGKISDGVSVQRIGQGGFIVVLLIGATGVAWRRK